MYQDFMAVINKLQDNGFYSVALVGEGQVRTEKAMTETPVTPTPEGIAPPADVAHPATIRSICRGPAATTA